MYHYKANYRSNYDGDTIRFDIDLGFGIWLKDQVVRLYGVDTPELRRDTLEDARKAKAFIYDRLSNATLIELHTYKDAKEKYGRWLATVIVDGTNLNQELVELGYAKVYT